jgi:hypothetical protein
LEKPDGSLTEQGPRLIWLSDAENDIRELNVKRLRRRERAKKDGILQQRRPRFLGGSRESK